MKFGVLQFFSWPQRRVPLPTVYERALQRIAIMVKTGSDGADLLFAVGLWAGGRQDGSSSNCMILSACE
jgi:hypothetical protein